MNTDMPWERLEGETGTQYSAFHCYKDLGPKRTLVAAWYKYSNDIRDEPNPTEEPSSAFRRWYDKYKWKKRAEAWDDHLARIRAHEQEVAVAKEARKRTVDMERVLWETAEFVDEMRPNIFMRYVDKINSEDVTATQTNQAMRVWIDLTRLVAERTQGAAQTEQEDPFSEGFNHVEALLENTADQSGEAEGP